MNSSLSIPPQGVQSHSAENPEAILPWLHLLSRLFPITQSLVIGAGNGTDPLTHFLRDSATEAVTLVEADKGCFQQLQRTTTKQTTWSLCHQLIAPERGRTVFHKTTVPCENGLLEPEELASLWPRISSRETIEMQAITLADVMDGLQSHAEWLFIDCLPALPLLAGAGDNLSHVNVLVARATAGSSPVGVGAAKDPLVASMDEFGFQFLAFEPNRNPQTGHALFVRRRRAVEQKTIDSLQAEVLSLQEKLAESEFVRASIEKRSIQIENLTSSFESTISELGSLLSASSLKQKAQIRKLEDATSLTSLLLAFQAKGKSKP